MRVFLTYGVSEQAPVQRVNQNNGSHGSTKMFH